MRRGCGPGPSNNCLSSAAEFGLPVAQLSRCLCHRANGAERRNFQQHRAARRRLRASQIARSRESSILFYLRFLNVAKKSEARHAGTAVRNHWLGAPVIFLNGNPRIRWRNWNNLSLVGLKKGTGWKPMGRLGCVGGCHDDGHIETQVEIHRVRCRTGLHDRPVGRRRC